MRALALASSGLEEAKHQMPQRGAQTLALRLEALLSDSGLDNGFDGRHQNEGRGVCVDCRSCVLVATNE